MTMFANKYPNTSRTVSGLTPIYNTDSIIEVDTSTVAATINLDAIPAGFWNTIWKLYIVDKSNNASVNNITINAGTGQTINGQSSLVINQNGGSVLIRVISNTKFLGSLTIVNPTGLTLTTTGTSGAATLVGNNLNIPQYSGGGGSSLEIKNQGTTLTPTATSIDFVGAGVSSTNIGTAVTVTINGVTVISLTNSALLILINNGTVVAGQSYLVTDAPYDCLGVLLQGVTTTSVTESGNANFYVADYQGAGNYNSLINAPTGFIGSWTTIVCTVAQYQVIVYNNRNYQNLTGVWGSAPSGDATNWLLLAPSLTTGYFIETDAVLYKVATNDFIYREDKRGNKVTQYINSGVGTNTVRDFPWGNDTVYLNTILGNSLLFFRNSNAAITSNFLDSGKLEDITPFSSKGVIQFNTITSNSEIVGTQVNLGAEVTGNIVTQQSALNYTNFISGTIKNNTIQEVGTISLSGTISIITFENNIAQQTGGISFSGTNNNLIIANHLAKGGTLQLTNCSNLVIENCESSDGINVTFTSISTATTFTAKKVYAGFSNWEATLSAIDVIVGVSLSIPSNLNYVGIFTISNAVSPTITTIVNLPTNHPVTLKPNATSSIRVVPTAIATATTNEVVETASTNVGAATTYIGRTNGCDEAILKKYGTLVGLTIKNIWI
jgi:hypothetical protein